MGFFSKLFKKEKKEIFESDKFVFYKKTKTYNGTINDIKFCADELNQDIVEYSEKLATEYNSNLSKIADFMLNDEAFDNKEGMYKNISKEQLLESLNTPTIRLVANDYCEIAYTNHTLDDEHILSFEVSGVYNKFYYLSING